MSDAPLLQPTPVDSGHCYDVVVVGGGIVGATAALALCRAGLEVVLLEANPPQRAIARDRAYALSLQSAAIFRQLDVWDALRPQIEAFDTIQLSDGEHPGVVRFRPEDLQRHDLGYIGEHRPILSTLYRALQGQPGFRWPGPVRVEQIDYRRDRVLLQGSDDDDEALTLQARLVIAADGPQSPTREQAGLHSWGWRYWQSCLTCVVRHERPHQRIAYERFWPEGPFAILPLPGDRSQVVWTAPHGQAQALAEAPEPEFLAELQRRYGTQMGALRLENRRQVFPVAFRQGRCYRSRRLALVGDAAHGCHPVGGQGMNLGIRDAAALAELVGAAVAAGEDPGSDRILARYDRWRRPEVLVILLFTDLLDRLFSNRWWPLVGLRRLGLWLMRHLPPARHLALRLMTGQLGRAPQLPVLTRS